MGIIPITEISFTSKTPDRTNMGKNGTKARIIDNYFIFNQESIDPQDRLKRCRNAGDFTPYVKLYLY